MNVLFLGDLEDTLEEMDMTIYPSGVKNLFEHNDSNKNFPMICFEETNDSDISVEMDETKFLNDDIYKKNWYVISNAYDENDYIALLNIFTIGKELKIEVLEVNKEYRSTGLGRAIVEAVEDAAEINGISRIWLSPFDTDAMNFWHHMGYTDDCNFNCEKILE